MGNGGKGMGLGKCYLHDAAIQQNWQKKIIGKNDAGSKEFRPPAPPPPLPSLGFEVKLGWEDGINFVNYNKHKKNWTK